MGQRGSLYLHRSQSGLITSQGSEEEDSCTYYYTTVPSAGPEN